MSDELTEDEKALIKSMMTDIKLWTNPYSSDTIWAYECKTCGSAVGVGTEGQSRYDYTRSDAQALKHIQWHINQTWDVAPLG